MVLCMWLCYPLQYLCVQRIEIDVWMHCHSVYSCYMDVFLAAKSFMTVSQSTVSLVAWHSILFRQRHFRQWLGKEILCVGAPDIRCGTLESLSAALVEDQLQTVSSVRQQTTRLEFCCRWQSAEFELPGGWWHRTNHSICGFSQVSQKW